MKTKLWSILLLCLLVSCSSSQKSDCPDDTEKLTQWRNETLRITGIGLISEGEKAPEQKRLMAERASKIEALRLLTLQIKDLPVDRENKVGNYLPENWALSGFTVETVTHREDGSCETTISMPLAQIWEVVTQTRVSKN